jgi:hypothetical protein
MTLHILASFRKAWERMASFARRGRARGDRIQRTTKRGGTRSAKESGASVATHLRRDRVKTRSV